MELTLILVVSFDMYMSGKRAYELEMVLMIKFKLLKKNVIQYFSLSNFENKRKDAKRNSTKNNWVL